MSNTKSEKIKFYVVISLSIILMISVYYRFIHTRISAGKKASSPVQAVEKRPQIPSVIRDNQPLLNLEQNRIKKYSETPVRDIFDPALPIREKNEMTGNSAVASSEKVTDFYLKGIIKSNKNAVAIIDGRFLKENDYVGNYRIKKINEKDVVLEQGGITVKLELLKK